MVTMATHRHTPTCSDIIIQLDTSPLRAIADRSLGVGGYPNEPQLLVTHDDYILESLNH